LTKGRQTTRKENSRALRKEGTTNNKRTIDRKGGKTEGEPRFDERNPKISKTPPLPDVKEYSRPLGKRGGDLSVGKGEKEKS